VKWGTVGAAQNRVPHRIRFIGRVDDCMADDVRHNEGPSASFPGYAGGMARSWRARTPRPIWFSDAHEAEAKEAELRKPPSRLGKWVLRRLGYRGDLEGRAPHVQTRRSHERPIHPRSEEG
jgi:hypothetical protein